MVSWWVQGSGWAFLLVGFEGCGWSGELGFCSGGDGGGGGGGGERGS